MPLYFDVYIIVKRYLFQIWEFKLYDWAIKGDKHSGIQGGHAFTNDTNRLLLLIIII